MNALTVKNATNLDALRRSVPARAVCVAALALAAPALTAASAEAAKPIPGQYIVTLEKGHDPHAVADKLGAKPRHIYRSALNGFAAKLTAGQVNALQRNPTVRRVEQDQLISASATQTIDSDGQPWGLDRIDQTSSTPSLTYSFNQTGAGVRAYILDSGIAIAHPEFEGRATHAYDATDTTPGDCTGHGTHVAGTVGSKTYGVAKKALLRNVKVLSGDCSGSGYVSDIIDGIDWVRENHVKPAVANMSFGGAMSASQDEAVTELVLAGVFVSVAAGNDGANACFQSPARAQWAYTVGATAPGDVLYATSAGSTNWGPCVDIFAPGQGIRSTSLGNTTRVLTGTSMAAPHVAGTAALLCSVSAYQCQPYAIMAWLQNNALNGAIQNMTAPSTVNRMLSKRAL